MRPTPEPPLLGNTQRHCNPVTRRSTSLPRDSAFTVGYSARRSVLQTAERHYQPLLPRPFLTTTCRQQGPFARRALPRVTTTTDPSATRSSFPRLPGSAGYTTDPTPGAFSLGQDGLLQLLGVSCVSVLPVPPRRCGLTRQPSLRQPVQPSPPILGLGHRVSAVFEATCPFACAAARKLARHPIDDFVERLQLTRFPSWLLSKLRGLWLLPRWDSLTPTEHTCLIWTHGSAPAR